MIRDRALLAALALSALAALSVTAASYAHAAANPSDANLSGSDSSRAGSPGLGSSSPVAVSAPAPVRFGAPLAGALVVLRAFEPPPTPYSSGHRDVDLAALPGAAVLAAGDGRVSFAGPVAGRGVLVIAHPDGIRTEYEPVVALVHAGAPVTRGELVARVAALSDGCRQSCLRWGARDRDGYIDPLRLLAELGPVRLLPRL
jgi:murein DD-endopeptidase MepM/ murein hydrolase activator NlpD